MIVALYLHEYHAKNPVGKFFVRPEQCLKKDSHAEKNAFENDLDLPLFHGVSVAHVCIFSTFFQIFKKNRTSDVICIRFGADRSKRYVSESWNNSSTPTRRIPYPLRDAHKTTPYAHCVSTKIIFASSDKYFRSYGHFAKMWIYLFQKILSVDFFEKLVEQNFWWSGRIS